MNRDNALPACYFSPHTAVTFPGRSCDPRECFSSEHGLPRVPMVPRWSALSVMLTFAFCLATVARRSMNGYDPCPTPSRMSFSSRLPLTRPILLTMSLSRYVTPRHSSSDRASDRYVYEQWIEEVRSICGPTIPVILVGCKSDLRPAPGMYLSWVKCRPV